MKTKKVMLGALVFVFAVGTAFASLYQQTPHINAAPEEQGPPPFVCGDLECTPITLPVACNGMSEDPCEVQVTTQASGGNPEITTVYDDDQCTTPLKHDAGVIDATNQTFCDVE